MPASPFFFPEIDLTGPDELVAGVPDPWVRRLRREVPVDWHEESATPTAGDAWWRIRR